MEQTKNTALLIMDVQSAIVQMISDAVPLINNIVKAIDHARQKNIPVIYVIVGFRNGTPEISINNKSFSAAKERWANANMEDWMKILPAVAPLANEVVVTKRRISAFTGSDLEVVLRAWDIQHLVLTGISTSGVVLSTTREAADKDYRLTILTDCCGDADEEVHRVLTTKILSRQADVMTVDEWSKV